MKRTQEFTPEQIEEKVTDFELAIKMTLSERTVQEYLRVVRQLLSATRKNPMNIMSKGKWLQVKSVERKLKAEGIIKKSHRFPGVPEKWTRREDRAKTVDDKRVTPDQFERLLQSLPKSKKGQELQLACKIAYYGGLRASEVLSLSQKNIYLNGHITLRFTGKGNKARKSFLPKALLAEMETFKGFTINQRYIDVTIWRTVQRLQQEDPTFPDTSFHGLRHSFATNLINAGVPVHELQHLLGHSNLQTTSIYLHFSDECPSHLEKLGY
jgi:integrase